MKHIVVEITAALEALSDAEKKAIFPKFFRAGKGEYGEGDRFLGVVVPQVRAVAKQYRNLTLDELHALLQSEWHFDEIIRLA